ncbi:hypothetical protein OG898_28935 [Streptomyces sp. NBC_00193]|uniref:WD40 repeat domain-containing protein n=1 Tax=unclassified Streptomyces TaxID=2593676 RepID=UPI002251549D|nr:MULTISPECIES: hypothetical protein [unclassified Streptomyces]MCX5129875.1 hypothetical protein [Streptomyces sp. NBC_00347]MCX5300444.1 hypothetical protein [Streptomyces sp. NBC_00193]
MERRPSTAWPTCFTTTPDGLPMAVWLETDRVVRSTVWDPAYGTERTTSFLLSPVISSPLSLTPVPAAHGATATIAVVGRRGITLVDLASERIVTTMRSHGRTGVFYLRPCVLPSHGRILLAAATSGDIHLWDTADGSPVARWNAPDTLALAAIPLADGRTLLASGAPSGVRIWDPLTGELRHTLLTGAPVHALAVGAGPVGPVLHIHGPAGLATLTLDEHLL